ncbi:hypothetical protein GCM10009007_12770 [Formosimonas limnophila]|uniref:Glycosyl transferase family 1 domain-containing protein n=1 Tax=Formosimonas limnophila TaxID=1384487 RepID=A0A8J3FZD4_9BURK|nr:glycosyltransferase [Formosimonas limnophila]GHA73302.1 hypothetical protein GCM10009007_12770 [Formosimonas limnophila]
MPSSTSWREKLNLKPDTIVIGSVGRLNYSKGMDVLIKAYQQVAPINSVLVIAGEGPHRAKLEKLCAGDTRIHLLGHQADVRSVLSSINLFVSASREETFGLAIIEAMQQGLPVIASATEGPSQLLSSHPIPLLPPGEVEPLAQALKAWLQRHIQTKPQQINYDLRDFLPTLALQRMDGLYLDALAVNQASTRSRRSDATCPLQ